MGSVVALYARLVVFLTVDGIYIKDEIFFSDLIWIHGIDDCSPPKVVDAKLMILMHLLAFHFLTTLTTEMPLERMGPFLQ